VRLCAFGTLAITAGGAAASSLAHGDIAATTGIATGAAAVAHVATVHVVGHAAHVVSPAVHAAHVAATHVSAATTHVVVPTSHVAAAATHIATALEPVSGYGSNQTT